MIDESNIGNQNDLLSNLATNEKTTTNVGENRISKKKVLEKESKSQNFTNVPCLRHA